MDTEKWDKVVDIVWSAFIKGWISVECAQQMVVLIPKGNV